MGNSGHFLIGGACGKKETVALESIIRTAKMSPTRTIPILKYWPEAISLHIIIN